MTVIRTLIADFDGTLLDNVHQQIAAWSIAVAAAGLSLTVAQIAAGLGVGASGASAFVEPVIGRPLETSERQVLFQEHARAYRLLENTVRETDGTGQALRALASQGTRTIVVTGSAPGTVAALGRRLGWPPLHVVSSADGYCRPKPAADLVDAALAFGECLPNQSLLVGDTRWDMLAAAAAGVPAVAVSTGARSRPELEQAGARTVFSSFSAAVSALLAPH